MIKHSITHSSNANAGLNLGRYITLINNNIKFICITVIITSLIGFVVSYLVPKKFQASSTISIEENIVSDLVKGIAITSSAKSKVRLLEVELLSRNMLLEVASLLDLDLMAQTHEQKENLVLKLRQSTFIEHDNRRGIFSVSFQDNNAVIARDFVNTLIRVYIETSTSEKRQESFDATSFLSDQIEIFQTRIQTAQEAIDKFKAEQGIFLSLNESFIQQKINGINQQLDSIRIEKNRLLSEQHMLSDASKLAEELYSKENELRNAQAIYTQKHPIVQRLTLDVEALTKRLKEEQSKPTSESVNTAFQGAQIELKSLEETEKNLLVELDENLKNLELLPAIRTQLSDLEQQKSNEMSIYQKLVGRFGQSEVSKQMELQDKAVSFKVIDAAVTPSTFVFPKRFIFMIGGIIAGFGLAVGLIIARSILLPKIYTAEDLHAYAVPVLVKLPEIVQPEVLAKKRKVNIIVIAITLCIISAVCAAAAIEFLGFTFIERFFPS